MFTNIDQALDILRGEKEKFIAKFTMSVTRVVNFVHTGVLSRHPVWSGESISAWLWSVDTEGGGGIAAGRKYSKADRERFGHTGGMGLGSEPMRATATAKADASLAMLRIDPKDPFHKYVFSNNHPRTAQLEFGMIPRTSRSRSPAGMIRVTESEVAAMIGTVLSV